MNGYIIMRTIGIQAIKCCTLLWFILLQELVETLLWCSYAHQCFDKKNCPNRHIIIDTVYSIQLQCNTVDTCKYRTGKIGGRSSIHPHAPNFATVNSYCQPRFHTSGSSELSPNTIDSQGAAYIILYLFLGYSHSHSSAAGSPPPGHESAALTRSNNGSSVCCSYAPRI